MINIIIGFFGCFFGWYAFKKGREYLNKLFNSIYDSKIPVWQCEFFFDDTLIFFSLSIVSWTIGTHLILREIEILLGVL